MPTPNRPVRRCAMKNDLGRSVDGLKAMAIEQASEYGIGRNTTYKLLSQAIDDCGSNIYDSLAKILEQEAFNECQ